MANHLCDKHGMTVDFLHTFQRILNLRSHRKISKGKNSRRLAQIFWSDWQR